LNELNNKYITLEECVEYINENLILEFTLYRLKNISKYNPLRTNFIVENNVSYIKKDYVYDSLKLIKNSINVMSAVKRIHKYLRDDLITFENIRLRLSKKLNTYKIDLFNLSYNYMSKSDFITVLTGIDEIKEKECITEKELLHKVNSMFKGNRFTRSDKKIFGFIIENNLQVIDKNFVANFCFRKNNLYPKKTVDMVIDNLKKYIKQKKVRLINISFEQYLTLSEEDFNKNYRLLSLVEFIEIQEYVQTPHFHNIEDTFKSTDVKVIWISKGDMYVSRKEFNEFMEFKNNYVGTEYFRALNIRFNAKIATSNEINIRTYKHKSYIKKDDIKEYLKVTNFNLEFLNAKSMYDRVIIKIKYFPNENENNYPKFMKYFLEFIRYTNRNVTTFEYVGRSYKLYNIILDNIKKDFEPQHKIENNRLFNKVIKLIYESQNYRHFFIQFVNYLRDKKGFDIIRIFDMKERGATETYTKEQFITLLTKLIEIVANKDNLRKLYRNWNLSTAVAYIFMHYCLAWRKMDLIAQLPTPNLKQFDGVTGGEQFIKWLESDNSISDEIADTICKGLEDTTERLRLKASKNNITLSCIISNSLAKEVATLLCINEANRQIHCCKVKRYRNEQHCFNQSFTESKRMQSLLKENFNIDLEEILGDSFDNIKMTKGFLSMVKEKAEELNLAYSYYYAQVARGHTPTKGALAETTKIYLQKDISKASVMAFATGTMGSVAYTLLKLVDNDFVNKSDEEQIKDIQNLNMTPYTIEKNVKTISNKISVIQIEINNFIKYEGHKEGFLKELLYGQNSYGIEKRTKCLLKITKKNEIGINRIKSKNFNEKNVTNKWCPYNRKSCIGCEYMIALRYFIYEFEIKFNECVWYNKSIAFGPPKVVQFIRMV